MTLQTGSMHSSSELYPPAYSEISHTCTCTRKDFSNNGESVSLPDEHQPLLSSVTQIPCTCGRRGLETSDLVQVEIGLYRRRWYLLGVFSAFGFLQGALLDVYVVVAESAEAAFGWSDAQTSIMQNWFYISYVVALLPTCWLIEWAGLRMACVLGIGLTFFGTVVRAISVEPPLVTLVANIGNILVGLAGPAASTIGPVFSSTWFPPNQRTTATAIGTIAGFLGASVCFVLGPNIVDVPVLINASVSQADFSNLARIRSQMLKMRYGECAMTALVLLLILIYFPAKPNKPPSLSAHLEKVSFAKGTKQLFKKQHRSFWLVCFAFAFSSGTYDIWSSLFDVNLKQYGVSEREAGWLACLAVLIGGFCAVGIGLLADVLEGRMKLFSVFLLCGLVLSSIWLTLICLYRPYIPYSTAQLYSAVLLQGICVNGPIPLYYEMAIESHYPISENVISGILSLVYNITPLGLLAVFLVPQAGAGWMNWFFVGSSLICVPLILFYKERSLRSMLDQHVIKTISEGVIQ